MNDDCRTRQGDLAALALGRLDDNERTRLQAHVDGCALCRTTLYELRATARALPYASLDHLDIDDAPSSDLAERIARTARDERRRAHRTRLRRVGAAVVGVAAVLLLAVGFVVMARDGDSPTALQPFAVAPNGAVATFGLARNDQGTKIVLRQSGLDPTRVYWMWLADESGQRYNAGTFRGTEHEETITLQSALPLEDTVRVWCTDAETGVVLDSWVK
jgi:hypothetical protein